MSDATSIEWTDTTWNPVTGCDRVSPGCAHCYALTLAKRLKAMGSPRYQRDGGRASGPGFGVTLHADKLDEPLSWRRPRRVFVNSMSDLFHDEIPDAYILAVFETMAVADRHVYQVLTKRPARMRALVTSSAFVDRFRLERGALPNVWLGVSVENQHYADERIPALLETPAAVRFLSCEPLLGPVDLSRWLGCKDPICDCEPWLDWIIVGGESGPRARPMDLAWARALRDQCDAAGVPLFVKQLGGRTPGARLEDLPTDLRRREFPT